VVLCVNKKATIKCGTGREVGSMRGLIRWSGWLLCAVMSQIVEKRDHFNSTHPTYCAYYLLAKIQCSVRF